MLGPAGRDSALYRPRERDFISVVSSAYTVITAVISWLLRTVVQIPLSKTHRIALQ